MYVRENKVEENGGRDETVLRLENGKGRCGGDDKVAESGEECRGERFNIWMFY